MARTAGEKDLHVPLRIFLGNNLVDEPLGNVEDLRWGVIADKVFDSLQILFFGWLDLRVAIPIREHDKHPFVPRLHHPHDAHPAKLGMLPIGLHDPVQIPSSVLHQVGEIGLDEDVDRQTLARLDRERKVQLFDDLATGTIGAKKVLGAHLVLEVGNVVADGCCNEPGLCVFLKGEQCRVKSSLEPIQRCVANQDGLKKRLR